MTNPDDRECAPMPSHQPPESPPWTPPGTDHREDEDGYDDFVRQYRERRTGRYAKRPPSVH